MKIRCHWRAVVAPVALMLTVSDSLCAAELPSLAEFAIKSVGWATDPQLRDSLGAVAFQTDRVAGMQDSLEYYVDFNSREFVSWCRKHGAKVDFESGATVIPNTAGALWPVAASDQDASWVCKGKDGSVVGAVLRGAPRVTQVDYWGGGKVPAYEFRYAFFEGPSWLDLPARRDTALAVTKATADEARAVGERRAAERSAKRDAATARLRAEPKVGDSTSLGMIIEIKPPLALIQLRPELRESRKASQEWVKIEALSAGE